MRSFVRARGESGRCMRSWAAPVGLCLLAGSLQLGSLGCAGPGRDPDIVLITLDTTRADRLGCYGSTIAATPHLDRVAEEAILFENAITSVPLTLPSHASILTGLHPPSHGARNNASFRVDDEITTLAERLSARGYHCAAFVSAYVLDHAFGLQQGFAHYDDALGGVERSADETTARAVDYLARQGEQPLFLWVHYFDPHTPWAPPEPFASDTRGSAYDAEISSMDAGLGELLEALRARGRYGDAHLIIVADHGEGLGDHREHEHGIFLYEECLRVPWLWKLPGARRTGREPALVGTVDLVPTLCDLLRLPQDRSLEGASLRALLDGGAPPARAGLYAETMYPYYSYGWSPLEAWREADLKLIAAPEAELYDLSGDPAERMNLRNQRAASAARLRERLRAYRRARGWEAGAPAESGADPALVARLSSLGYVWSGGRGATTDVDSLPDPKRHIRVHEQFELGKLAAQAGRFEEAADHLAETVRAHPDNHAATYFMGLSLVRLGRPAEALPHLERHLSGAPDPNATLLMGDALLQLDRPREARTWYRRHLEEGPQKTLARERIGDALLAEGRYEEAVATYRGLAPQREAASILRKVARVRVRQERFAEAADLFTQAGEASAAAERGYFREWARAARTLA
ncbi:MAG: sulfatase-like hydrolase/transferase, partial [Candidatus Eisenbacteria bacterium]|nr:sulfatase-like hydrolase/transferase [Candidatus Eisenbacteria bacterium]